MRLLKFIEVKEDLLKRLRYVSAAFFIVPAASIFLFAYLGELNISVGAGIALGASMAAIGVMFFVYDFHRIMLQNSIFGYAVSAMVFAVSLSAFLIRGGAFLPSLSLALLAFNAADILVYAFQRIFCDEKINPKNLKSAAFGIGALVFTLFIYLPTDSFINNAEDFPFTYQSFIFYMLVPLAAVFLILALIAVILKESCLNGYLSFLMGVNAAVFVQYMFLNRNLSVITGDKIHWENYNGFSVLTTVIWLIILAAPFLLRKFAVKAWGLSVKKVPLFIGLIEAVSAVMLMIFSSGEAFASDVYVLSGEEQYKVSPNKNIITIILDATDNRYVKELLSKESDVFDGYKDFTLYTNTCSVFDSTFQSLTQIYSGITEKPTGIVADWNRKAWDGDMAEEFYDRFHKANYKMNFFVDSNWVLTDLEGKADNLESADLSGFGGKSRAALDISTLSLFRAAPFAVKRFIPVEEIDLGALTEESRKADFANGDFDAEAGSLSLADTDQNYFIVEHIKGTHAPFDIDGDPVKTTEYVLGVAAKYIDSLKKLGVYDDAVIIVMADHGTHNITDYPDSTPMFMIKESGRKGDKVTLSDAPIYFADLMSTYLVNGGFFGENDRALFGSSIYDFNEASVRTRTANYRVVDDNYPPSRVSPLVASYGYNVIYSYDFTGDTEELLRVIKEEGPTVIERMEESPS